MSLKSIHDKANSLSVGCEYTMVVIAKNNSNDAYGIAARDVYDDKPLCIKEIGSNRDITLSIVNLLNHHRVPYVHFLDVIDDLMNE